MRLIDADALITHLSDYQLQETPNWGETGYGNADAYEAITNCIDAVEHMPTIEPIKHGRWVKLYHDNYKCSECGSWWGSDYNDEIINDFNYCPNCGAKMLKGEDDE